MQKKDEAKVEHATAQKKEIVKEEAQPVPAEPEPMQIDEPVDAVEEIIVEKAPEKPKKKKKKTSYKAMMAAMTMQNDDNKAEKEKAKLRKVTGGGAFSKIDKI